jgi:hypothetical protein
MNLLNDFRWNDVYVFHLFNDQKRIGQNKTIIIDFTFLDFFLIP